MENLEYWYNYGFSGIIDDAAAMERAAGIEYITREVATFAKCDPNFLRSESAKQPDFEVLFSLYLIGRADEQRDRLAEQRTGQDAPTLEIEMPPFCDPDPLPEHVDGLYLRKRDTTH